jgi:MoaA/NifB/PqqE/SkfB family radical SAM enzyme
MEQVAYPKKLTIALTDRCNLKCFICWRDEFEQSRDSKGVHFDIAQLHHLEHAIRNAEMISLTGFGESFLHPRLHEALDYIYAVNPRDNLIMLISNGTALSYAHGRKLGSRLRELVISLNAANPEAYLRDMHPQANRLDYKGDADPRVRLEKLDAAGLSQFEKTCGKIREFLRGLEPADRRKVRLHYVVHRDNIAELSDFVLVAKELGVDTVGFYHYMVTQESRIDYSLLFHKEAFNQAVHDARILGRRIGVRVDANAFGSQAEQAYDKELNCTSPVDKAIVSPQGGVAPCCHAGDAPPLGQAFANGFDAVWFGQTYRMLREERYLDGCQTCNQYRRLDDPDVHFHPNVKTSKRYEAIVARAGTRQENPLKLLVICAGADGSQSVRALIERLCKANGAEAQVRCDSDGYALTQAVLHDLVSKDDSRLRNVMQAWRSPVVVANMLGFVMPAIRAAFGPGLKIIHLKRAREAAIAALVNRAELFPQNWGGYTALAGTHDIVRPTARHFGEMDVAAWGRAGLAGQIAWYYDKNHALIEAARPEFPDWLALATEELSSPATLARIAGFIDPTWTAAVPPAHLGAGAAFALQRLPDPYDRIRIARMLRDFDLQMAAASTSYPVTYFMQLLSQTPVGRARSNARTAAIVKRVKQQIDGWIRAAKQGERSSLPVERSKAAIRRLRVQHLDPERQIELERMLGGFDVRQLAESEGYGVSFFIERLVAPHVGDPAMHAPIAEALQEIADQLRQVILSHDAGALPDDSDMAMRANAMALAGA